MEVAYVEVDFPDIVATKREAIQAVVSSRLWLIVDLKSGAKATGSCSIVDLKRVAPPTLMGRRMPLGSFVEEGEDEDDEEGEEGNGTENHADAAAAAAAEGDDGSAPIASRLWGSSDLESGGAKRNNDDVSDADESATGRVVDYDDGGVHFSSYDLVAADLRDVQSLEAALEPRRAAAVAASLTQICRRHPLRVCPRLHGTRIFRWARFMGRQHLRRLESLSSHRQRSQRSRGERPRAAWGGA